MAADEPRRTCSAAEEHSPRPPESESPSRLAESCAIKFLEDDARLWLWVPAAQGFAADSEKDSSHRAQPARQHQDKPTQQLVCRFLLSWGQVVVAVDAPAGHRGDPG